MEDLAAIMMQSFFNAQREWSYKTFGPPEFRGPKGPLDHLQKEAREAYEERDEKKLRYEIADCLFLVFDAAHRHGMTYGQLADVALQKLLINEGRKWPAWGDTPPDKATEHDRSAE